MKTATIEVTHGDHVGPNWLTAQLKTILDSKTSTRERIEILKMLDEHEVILGVERN